MNEAEIKAAVFEALNNAVANGHDVSCFEDPELVAVDLTDLDADLEDQAIKDLVPHIKVWQEEHRG